MIFHHDQSFRYDLNVLAPLIILISTLAFTLTVHDSNAQEKNNSSVIKAKPPALPNGSAQTVVKPGMSDEEWKKAYKETGRPPFSRKSVKQIGGNVERD
ncbi:hypothetical protein [Burkholderia pseudomallei]|uniref:hypothetical protein n=1 Tax=Burkholderia pseudomallei TaxID=28450 RepID=UPI0009E5CD1F|nr:hypothetical protein [Burkholderia pseudomallei]